MSDHVDPSLRRARRWRAIWFVLMSVSIATFFGTWGWIAGILDAQSRGVWISGGELCVGYNEHVGDAPVWEADPYPGHRASWRPVRHAGVGWNFVAFPLWQPIALFAPLWAYYHGYIRGARRSDPSRCRQCGYSLRGLAADVAGTRRCPECGNDEPA